METRTNVRTYAKESLSLSQKKKVDSKRETRAINGMYEFRSLRFLSPFSLYLSWPRFKLPRSPYSGLGYLNLVIIIYLSNFLVSPRLTRHFHYPRFFLHTNRGRRFDLLRKRCPTISRAYVSSLLYFSSLLARSVSPSKWRDFLFSSKQE